MKCRVCAATHRTPRQRCPTCAACMEHGACNCLICKICKKQNARSNYCPRCGRCNEHHLMVIPAGRSFYFRDRCSLASGNESYHANPLRRSLGLEIELGVWNGMLEDRPANTTFVHDGSVTPSGMELVVSPAIGDEFLLRTNEVITKIQQHACKANESCGYHVHVDAAGDPMVTLRRVFVGFRLLQDQIFGGLVDPRRSGPSKNGNIYSAPLTTTYEELQRLLSLKTSSRSGESVTKWFHTYLYSVNYEGWDNFDRPTQLRLMAEVRDRVRRAAAHKYENAARRQAINFHSWFMRGTIEFRLKEGTTDPVEILSWPLFCGWFVEKLAATSETELLRWLDAPPKLMNLLDSWVSPSLPVPAMPRGIAEWAQGKLAKAKSSGLRPPRPGETPTPRPTQPAPPPRNPRDIATQVTQLTPAHIETLRRMARRARTVPDPPPPQAGQWGTYDNMTFTWNNIGAHGTIEPVPPPNEAPDPPAFRVPFTFTE
jgi:hypothetical protein